MSASRERKAAAKNLGIALQAAYRKLIEANGQEEIETAAVNLGGIFNTNIEFVIWTLKEYGGVKQLPFERLHAKKPMPVAANDRPLPVTPAVLLADTPACTCPPLEAGIIGRDRHMTACPQFVPGAA